jgi:hypothetical protein
VEAHKTNHDTLVSQTPRLTCASAVAKVTFLTPDNALVHANGDWAGFILLSGEAKDLDGIITALRLKQDGPWRLRALQDPVTDTRSTAERPDSIKRAGSMRTLPAVRHISVSVNRPPNEVYDFVLNPENYLPKWATGTNGLLTHVNGEWIAETPTGKVKIRFAERNTFGILDHDFILESGTTIHNPMRVVTNSSGSEIIRTLLREPDMSDEEFSEDAKWVEQDLKTLKDLLEK